MKKKSFLCSFRDSARTLLYDGGVYGKQLNFLYDDYRPAYAYSPNLKFNYI